MQFKFLLTSLLVVGCWLLVAESAGAAIAPIQTPGAKDFGLPNPPSSATSVGGLVNIFAEIVHWIYIIFFTFAAMMFIFAAFKYVTQGDNPEEMQKAHWLLIYGAIGVVVALLAVAMSGIISRFLENPGAGSGGGVAPAAPSVQSTGFGTSLEEYNAQGSGYVPPSLNQPRDIRGGSNYLAPQIQQQSAPVNPRGTEPNIPH